MLVGFMKHYKDLGALVGDAGLVEGNILDMKERGRKMRVRSPE